MKFFEAHDVREYKDADGNIPEIMMIDTNRSAGKTTAFIRKFIDDFLHEQKKFMVIFRFGNELSDVSETIFKDVRTLFFPEHIMTDKARARGVYYELFLDGESCGYAVAVNQAPKLKRYSHLFSDVQQMLFDEYQSEVGYVPDEVNKFQSLHKTVSRGQGQPVRFVPVYMLSNSVSIFNPYYDALGITTKIRSDTKIYKGSGFILIRVIVKDIANAQKLSGFNRAFGNSEYNKSSEENSFLNDLDTNVEPRNVDHLNKMFIFRSSGKLFTLYSDGSYYHVYPGGDVSEKAKYGVTESDKKDGFTSIRTTTVYYRLKFYFENGVITYENQLCKKAFYDLINS